MIKRYKTIFKEGKSLSDFFNKFPDDAKSWSQATDELREISKTAREYILELDYKEIKPLNFNSFSTPSKWNTESKKYINKVYKMMSDKCKKQFDNYLKEYFDIDKK